MDYGNYKNIEEWFLNLKKDTFAENNHKNYITIYTNIKEKLVSVFNETKAVAISINPNEFLTDHGKLHVDTVISRASEIIKANGFVISPYETFYLLTTIQLHDTGHIINGRKQHEQNTPSIINEFLTDLDTIEKQYIHRIIKSHSGQDDPIGKLNDNSSFLGVQINIKLIAAILRISDELAEDCLRASSYLLKLSPTIIGDLSKIFHVYSNSLKSCNIIITAHEVNYNFCLNKELGTTKIKIKDGDKYLVDEIYDRSLKTFIECIYYNRFIPETIRINRVSVNISFVDEKTLEPLLEEITYRLEEKGYPKLNLISIFDFDGTKDNNGDHKTGEYIRNKIKYNE